MPGAQFSADGHDGLTETIGLLYDAALDERLWAGLSRRIAAAFDSTSTVVKLHGPGDDVHLVEATENLIVAPKLQDWADYWHSRDLWVERTVAFGHSRIVTDQELITDRERRESGFYREWLRHLDIHHVIGAVFPTEGSAVAVLGIHRPEDAAGYDEKDRRKVALLLPHLQRALRLSLRVGKSALTRDMTLDSLNVLDTGVMLVDGQSQVLHANAIAEEMLAGSTELAVRAGRISASNPALHARLKAAIQAAVALAGGQLRRAEGAIRIDRAGRRAWTLTVSPLRPRWGRLAWQRPLALVLMRDPEYPPFLIDNLRALFAMTRAEAVVAAELARGAAPAEIAETLGVGLGTVRTHLKQILLKTETSRQAEAVAVISRSVAAIRTL